MQHNKPYLDLSLYHQPHRSSTCRKSHQFHNYVQSEQNTQMIKGTMRMSNLGDLASSQREKQDLICNTVGYQSAHCSDSSFYEM